MRNCVIIFIIIELLVLVTNIKAHFNCYKRLPDIPIDKCCFLPNFYTDAIREKCNSNDNHFKLDMGHQHLCFVSCAFDEIGIFNDGVFQEETLNLYLNDALQDIPDIIDNMKKAFKICIKNYEILRKMIATQGPCALYHVLVMDCVFIKTFKKCPNSVWSNTDVCNEIRDQWRECLPSEL